MDYHVLERLLKSEAKITVENCLRFVVETDGGDGEEMKAHYEDKWVVFGFVE